MPLFFTLVLLVCIAVFFDGAAVHVLGVLGTLVAWLVSSGTNSGLG
jgi:hypothetical protein